MTTQELKQQIEKVLGNSIRCLLPSYWWKRLFHQVVDRIDEAKEEVTNDLEIPIVESVEALESLDLPMGKLAVVAGIKETEFSARDCYQATAEEINNADDTNNFEQFTKIQKINIVGIPSISLSILFSTATKSESFYLCRDTTEVRAIFFTKSGEIDILLTNADGNINQDAVQEMNSRISGKDYRYVGVPTRNNNEITDEEFNTLDSFFKLATLESVSDQYIKGETSLERIAKESELTSSIIVNSIDELNALDVPQGTIASVVVHQGYGNFANCYQSSEEELTENLESGTNRINEEYLNKLTRIYGVRLELPSEPFGETIETSVVQYNQDTVPSSRVAIMSFISDGTISGTYMKLFGSKVPVFNEDGSLNDEFFNETQLYYDYPAYHLETVGNGHLLSKVFVPIMDYSDVYVKGTTWEKLAKESDLGNSGEEESSSNSLFFYAPTDANTEISDVEKQHNAESYLKIAEGFETDKYYDVKVLMSTSQLVTFDAIQIFNPAIDDGKLKLLFRWVSDGREQMVIVTSDGSAIKEDVKSESTELSKAVETITNTIIENEEITAAALNELNERVVTPYEYYEKKGGIASESAYNIMTKYLFTPFIISNNSTTTIPDELLNESQTSFFTDYYWNFMRLTGGEPIRTTQWANNIPQKFVGISSGLSFVIDFSNKTITPEQ